jgi:hypothetical protein
MKVTASGNIHGSDQSSIGWSRVAITPAMMARMANIGGFYFPFVDQCHGSDGRLMNPYFAALACIHRNPALFRL